MSAPLAARADITTRYASSVQLSVGGAHTSAERIGSSFSISGSGVDTTDGTTANTISAGKSSTTAMKDSTENEQF